MECWKSIHIDQYPLKLEPNNPHRTETDRVVRTTSIKQWKDDAKSVAAKVSFSRDAAKLWNHAPEAVKHATSKLKAKTEIKKYCGTFVI